MLSTSQKEKIVETKKNHLWWTLLSWLKNDLLMLKIIIFFFSRKSKEKPWSKLLMETNTNFFTNARGQPPPHHLYVQGEMAKKKKNVRWEKILFYVHKIKKNQDSINACARRINTLNRNHGLNQVGCRSGCLVGSGPGFLKWSVWIRISKKKVGPGFIFKINI